MLVLKFDEKTKRQMQEVAALARGYQSKVNAIARQTVNAAASRALAAIKRVIVANTLIAPGYLTRKRETVRAPLSVRKATGTRTDASVLITPKRLPVAAFRIGKGTQKKGAWWNIGEGKRHAENPKAFMVRVRGKHGQGGGHLGVFRRLTGKRLPLVELKGPSIAHVAAKDPRVEAGLKVDVQPWMQKEMTRRLTLLANER